MIPAVREGVFFRTPEPLPKGRHGLAHADVLARQRERLMIAGTELLAAQGYRAVGVRDVAARAHVSQPAFYECFADKDACLFAAHDRFVAVLTARLLDAVRRPSAWPDLVGATLDAYVGTLEEDPVVARAYLLELDALGPPARERRRASVHGIALLLREHRARQRPDGRDVPLSAYAAAIYALRQMAADRLERAEGDDLGLRGLAASLAPTVAAMLEPSAPRAG